MPTRASPRFARRSDCAVLRTGGGDPARQVDSVRQASGSAAWRCGRPRWTLRMSSSSWTWGSCAPGCLRNTVCGCAQASERGLRQGSEG
eukprot:215270-Chlamydomonas_euryale.AAC.4